MPSSEPVTVAHRVRSNPYMYGVKLITWDQLVAVYELRDGRAVLVSGHDQGPIELGIGDARVAKLEPGIYMPEDGRDFLVALVATYKGSRMRAEQF